jgi:hypothetical protein
MGPMRFPVSTKYADTNETLDIQDHKVRQSIFLLLQDS